MDRVQAEELADEIRSHSGIQNVEVFLLEGRHAVRTVGLVNAGEKIFKSFGEWIEFVERAEHEKNVALLGLTETPILKRRYRSI